MTRDEARRIVIGGMNYAAYKETDSSLYDSDKVRAASVRTAIAKHATRLLANEAVGKLTTRKKLATGFVDETAIAIEGTTNVWCCSVSLRNKLALLNVIETVG